MKKILLTAILILLCISCICGCAYVTLDHVNAGGTGGNSDGNKPDNKQVYTVTAGYDYGFHMPGKAVMLYSSSTLFFTIPQDHGAVLAGDSFNISYSGELLVQESYPSTVVIHEGEISQVSSVKATVITVKYFPASENGSAYAVRVVDGAESSERVSNLASLEYVITDIEKGSYVSLDEYAENTEGECLLYATVNEAVSENAMLTLSALYSSELTLRQSDCGEPDSEPIVYTCDLSRFPSDEKLMGYGEVRQIEDGKLLIAPGSEKARQEYGQVVWLVCEYAYAYSIGQVVTYTFYEVKAPHGPGEPLNIIANTVYME